VRLQAATKEMVPSSKFILCDCSFTINDNSVCSCELDLYPAVGKFTGTRNCVVTHTC
jgi:hypothetical protein